jgi:geranylgeranyl diphosphate synthase type II
LIGSRGAADLDAFLRFGFFLGAAFQIQDDILNLEPDAAYGKEIDGDLYEGKRTLMLIDAMARGAPEEQQRLAAFLELPRAARSAEEVAWLRAVIARLGSLERARALARGLGGAALHEFEIAFEKAPDSSDKRFIRSVAAWIFERD